jgi:hypothetical protein
MRCEHISKDIQVSVTEELDQRYQYQKKYCLVLTLFITFENEKRKHMINVFNEIYVITLALFAFTSIYDLTSPSAA